MRKRKKKSFYRQLSALVLAAAMLFTQSSAVFGAETADAAEDVTEDVAEAASYDAEAVYDEAVTADEAADYADEGALTEDASSEDDAEGAADEVSAADAEGIDGSDEAADPEDDDISADEAEDQGSPDTPSENTASNNMVSLSGGSISVTLSVNGTEKTLEYTEGVTSLDSHLEKYVGEEIGFDFSVVSGDSVTLVKDRDYKVSWFFQTDSDPERISSEEDDSFLVPGIITASVNGVSENGYSGSIDVKAKVISVPEEDLVYTASCNHVTVSNNNKKVSLYVALVSADAAVSSNVIYGKEVAPEGETNLYSYYDKDGVKHPVEGNMDLVLLGHPFYVYGAGDAMVKKEAFRTPPDAGEDESTPEDGYSKIRFSATVVKTTQRIKLTWKPSSKLGYKYYELQRLNSDGENFETLAGWHDKRGNLLAKTSYTYGKTAIERAESPAVFRLRCYDKKKELKADYITVAAPSLLYVEPGYDTDSMEYCFSKLYEDSELSYRLELAEKKTEKGKDAVGKRGFAQTASLASVYPSSDLWEIKDFKVKKGLTVDALREDFVGKADLKLNPGTTYYARVKSVYNYQGTDYTSAPSNIIGRKAGPTKAYTIDITGVKYTKPSGKATAKAAAEAKNKELMNEYLTELFKDVDEREGLDIDPSSDKSELFIHASNQGPDATSGYVIFMADRVSGNALKGFELLRSDSQYGTYKKLKLYKVGSNGEPAKYSGLYRWEPEDQDLKELFDAANTDIYYMQYSSFPPERTLYYAVRGVYKKGSATGGFGDGLACTPELDTVQNIYAFDGTIDKINLYWSFDSCVKEYWIYKKEYTGGEEGNPSEFTNLDDYKLLKKVKGKKSGTLRASSTKAADKELLESTSGNLVGNYVKFTDKDNTKYVDKSKNRVMEGTTYQYVVVPKYNVKNKDPEYNLDKKSDVAYGAATLTGAKIKNFAAKNYGVNRIRISWSKLKGASAYLVIRTTSNPKEEGAWTDEELFDISPESDKAALRKAFTSGAFVDYTAEVGQRYYYTIFAGSQKSSTISLASMKSAKSLPLAVTNVKVKSGDNFRRGARVTWTKNTRDSGYDVRYTIQCRDKSNGSSGYHEWRTLERNVSGTSYYDSSELPRGVVRQYRVVSTYGSVAGGIKEGDSYSKPTYIELSTGNTTLALNTTMSFTATPKRDGEPSVAKEKGMSISNSNSAVVKVVGSKAEGDHMTYTLQAVGKGVAVITVKADHSDWTSNSSTSNLVKTFVVTVK